MQGPGSRRIMRTSRAAAAMQRGDAEDLFNRFTRATSADDLPPPPLLLLLLLLLLLPPLLLRLLLLPAG